MLLQMIKISWSRSDIRLIFFNFYYKKNRKITSRTCKTIFPQDMLPCLQSYSPPSFIFNKKHNSLPSTYLYISLGLVIMFLFCENENNTVMMDILGHPDKHQQHISTLQNSTMTWKNILLQCSWVLSWAENDVLKYLILCSTTK